MHGRRCVVQDYARESIHESKISIHSSPTSGCVDFKLKSFVYVHRKEKLQSSCSVYKIGRLCLMLAVLLEVNLRQLS